MIRAHLEALAAELGAIRRDRRATAQGPGGEDRAIAPWDWGRTLPPPACRLEPPSAQAVAQVPADAPCGALLVTASRVRCTPALQDRPQNQRLSPRAPDLGS